MVYIIQSNNINYIWANTYL